VRAALQECTEAQRSSALGGEDSARGHHTSVVWGVQESKAPARCTACSDVPKLAMLRDGSGKQYRRWLEMVGNGPLEQTG